MNVELIKKISKDYEMKRSIAYENLVAVKNDIYSKIPRLKEIDDEINSYAIKSAKLILLAETDDKYSYVKNLEDNIEKLKKEKLDILKKANIDENSFEPKFTCNICNDTGLVNNKRCSCYDQQIIDYSYDNSNLKSFSNQTFENFKFEYYSEETLENIGTSPRKNIENITKIAKSFIEDFNNTSSKNLLFTGEPGLGKTFLSSCIANDLIKKGKSVLYQTAPLLMDSMIAHKFKNTKESDKLYKDVFNVDLLIIDDLGVESLNSMKFTELFTIINTRLLNANKATKTIISTNLSLKDLFEIYEERIMSRIIGNYSICNFIGDDIRIKNR